MDKKVVSSFRAFSLKAIFEISLISLFAFIIPQTISLANIEEDATTSAPDLKSIKLDVIEDATRVPWSWPRETTAFPEYIFYYRNETDPNLLKHNSQDKSCPNVISKYDTKNELSGFNGIWTACKDHNPPEGCAGMPSAPCHPFIKYTSIGGGGGHPEYSYKTIKMTFALYGLAILRLRTCARCSGTEPCFDYSLRKDPLSPCEFIPLTNAQTDDNVDLNGVWQHVRFTYDPERYTYFSSFQVELISRFDRDAVIVDKIEALVDLLCGELREDEEYPCTTTTTERIIPTPNGTTTTTTSTTGSSGSETPATSTTEISTTLDPEKTTKGSSSALSNSIFVLLLSLFLAYY